MTTIGKPKIDKRPKIIYMGIRTIAPFKGMCEPTAHRSVFSDSSS